MIKYLLASLLALSIALNIVLWQQVSSLSTHSVKTQPLTSSSAKAPLSDTGVPSATPTSEQSTAPQSVALAPQSDYPHKEELKQATLLLRTGEFDQLAELLQTHLRNHPEDIEFLLLEGDFIQQTETVSFALTHYYELLEYPLTATQQKSLINKIAALVKEHSDKLSNINAWDILATFLEPLWQREPYNRNYIVTLAESYAHLALEGPTENVLASLLPDDPEVLRIRAILPNQLEQPLVEEEPIVAEDYTRAVSLAKVGDQFVVEARLASKQLELLIDTGATTTVISESVFNQQGGSRLKKNAQFVGLYEINTAGGKVEAPVYRFAFLSVGGLAVRDTAVIVMPTFEFARADGLLGMNFLREFDFRIDQQQAILYLR